MVTRFDLSGLMQVGKTNAPTYPREQLGKNTDGVLERIQVQYAVDRYAFAITHPMNGHWSGYALVERAKWAQHRDTVTQLVFPRISYSGYSTAHICWMEMNRSNRLTKPVILTADDEDDYWVGFDLYREHVSAAKARELLDSFSNHLWSLIYDGSGT